MNFDWEKSLLILSRTPAVLDTMLKDLPEFWSDHHEGKGRWSAREVVGHLIYGEIEDWVPRTRIILFAEDKRFPPLDPHSLDEAIVGRSLDELLTEFREKREDNLKEMRNLNLQLADFDKTGIHPEFGEVTLRQHLATWTVHDLNHLYQISRAVGKKYSEDIGPWKKYIRLVRD